MDTETDRLARLIKSENREQSSVNVLMQREKEKESERHTQTVRVAKSGK